MNRLIFQIMLNSFLISLLLTGSYYSVNTIYKYYKFEIITKYEIIREYTPSPFPAVSICDTDLAGSWNDFYPKIIKCSFDSDADCLDNFESYFITYNDTYDFRCYRFNSGNSKMLSTSRSGDSTGFFLELLAPSSKDYSRLKLFIHNQTSNPSSDSKGFYIASGSINYFSVKRIFNHKISRPENECFENVFLFQQNKTIIEQMKENYNQQECWSLCQSLKFFEANNCSVPYLKNLKILVSNETVKTCFEEFKNKFQFKLCEQYCPPQCNTVRYDINHFLENTPATGHVKMIHPSFSEFENYDELKRSFFSIKVFYESNEYTLISQEFKMNIDHIITCFGLTIVLITTLLTIITFRINFLIK